MRRAHQVFDTVTSRRVYSPHYRLHSLTHKYVQRSLLNVSVAHVTPCQALQVSLLVVAGKTKTVWQCGCWVNRNP